MDGDYAVRDGRPIRGERPTAGQRLRAPKRHAEGRRCWCGTRLTRYNPNDTCYAHSDVTFRRVRGHVTRTV